MMKGRNQLRHQTVWNWLHGPQTRINVLHSLTSDLLLPVSFRPQISVMSPGDIVKVRLQCQTESRARGSSTLKPKYRGPVHCLLTIVKEEGLRGLYRGAFPLMLRDGPSYATYFLTYSTVCEWLTDGSADRPGESRGRGGPAVWIHTLYRVRSPHEPAIRFFTQPPVVFPDWSAVMLAGGVAGMTGWTVGTPMDVIKARLQMDGARDPSRYRGLFHCVTETARVEGAGVFFRSLGINWLRAFPVNMVVFVTYELLTGLLQAGPPRADPPRIGFE